VRAAREDALMADFFKWASDTPAANVMLVLALGIALLTFCVAVFICIMAFMKNRPIELWGFKIPASKLVYETGVVDFPANRPKNFYNFKNGEDPGDRSLPVQVVFSETFTAAPRVMISIIKIDVGNNIIRLLVSTENITKNGFTIRFKTWRDSRLYDTSVSWIAIGN
jgi:hypothetical protein